MIGLIMENWDDHHTDYHCNPDARDDENDQIADEERTFATSAPLHRPTKHEQTNQTCTDQPNIHAHKQSTKHALSDTPE